MADSKQSLVIIGNPGTGKSTSINCLVGKMLFKSGVSCNGSGVTYKLDVREHQGVQYMDTPGLSDIQLRPAAAIAIEQALKIGGIFQIIFMMCLESNRIRDDDLTTLKIVLEAANQITPNSYAIIFNKCCKREIRRLDVEGFTWNLHKRLMEMGVPTTTWIHFAGQVEELVGEDDKVVPLPSETADFIKETPMLMINRDKVKVLEADKYEEFKEAIAKERLGKELVEDALRLAEERERRAHELREKAEEELRKKAAELERREQGRQERQEQEWAAEPKRLQGRELAAQQGRERAAQQEREAEQKRRAEQRRPAAQQEEKKTEAKKSARAAKKKKEDEMKTQLLRTSISAAEVLTEAANRIQRK